MKNKKNINRNMAYLLIFIAFLLLAFGVGNTAYSIYDCTTSKKAYADEVSGGSYTNTSYNYLVTLPSLDSAYSIPSPIKITVESGLISITSYYYDDDDIIKTFTATTAQGSPLFLPVMAYNYDDIQENLSAYVIVGIPDSVNLAYFEEYTFLQYVGNGVFYLGANIQTRITITFNMRTRPAGIPPTVDIFSQELSFLTAQPYIIQLGDLPSYALEQLIDDTYSRGYDYGYDVGVSNANADAYQNGYLDGLNTADSGTFINLFDSLFYAMGRFLTSLLNFEILGINFFGLVSGLLTLALCIMILRFVL